MADGVPLSQSAAAEQPGPICTVSTRTMQSMSHQRTPAQPPRSSQLGKRKAIWAICLAGALCGWALSGTFGLDSLETVREYTPVTTFGPSLTILSLAQAPREVRSINAVVSIMSRYAHFWTRNIGAHILSTSPQYRVMSISRVSANEYKSDETTASCGQPLSTRSSVLLPIFRDTRAAQDTESLSLLPCMGEAQRIHPPTDRIRISTAN